MRIRIAVVAAVAVVVTAGAAMGVASAAPAAHTKVFGVVGINDAFKITLKNAKGKKIKTLKAGTYTFVITDGSHIHSYVVEGPGVERDITSVNFKGKKTVNIKLRKGKYKYYCRPHESSMFGFVKVT